MCVVYDVHPYGGTGVRAFMHEPHIMFFMRCSLDIMRMCIRTSWSTAGMLVHKFNYRSIETKHSYLERP